MIESGEFNTCMLPFIKSRTCIREVRRSELSVREFNFVCCFSKGENVILCLGVADLDLLDRSPPNLDDVNQFGNEVKPIRSILRNVEPSFSAVVCFGYCPLDPRLVHDWPSSLAKIRFVGPEMKVQTLLLEPPEEYLILLKMEHSTLKT